MSPCSGVRISVLDPKKSRPSRNLVFDSDKPAPRRRTRWTRLFGWHAQHDRSTPYLTVPGVNRSLPPRIARAIVVRWSYLLFFVMCFLFVCGDRIEPKRSAGGPGRGKRQAVSQGPPPFGRLHHLQPKLPAGVRGQVSRTPHQAEWKAGELVAASVARKRVFVTHAGLK